MSTEDRGSRDWPDFNAERFNAEQRVIAAEHGLVMVPDVRFPCQSCGRLTPLAELEQHGYQCEECHHVRRDTPGAR